MLLSFAAVLYNANLAASPVDILPRPVLAIRTVGELDASNLALALGPRLPKTVRALAETFAKPSLDRAPYRPELSLHLNPALVRYPEGYRIEISQTGIKLVANKAAGLYYGLQTLRQLNRNGRFPCLLIEDEPRFSWRGAHLDVSRHFFDIAYVKRFIDTLAKHKMNVFHWHLVDGPGWRIEIKKHPKLTEIGAWRKDLRSQPWNWRATRIDPHGKQSGDYGGFYTQEEIREVARYAKERFVTIVPEIEMPGHSYAALVAYPELSCYPERILDIGLTGGDIFCAGNEGSFTLLEDVLDEVLPLFPDSPLIHLGGDEVLTDQWSRCAKCRKRIKEEGLQDAKALQPFFMKRIASYLAKRGRSMIGWDEIADGELPKGSKVMVWRDAQSAAGVVRRGFDVVMAPIEHVYFDQAQTDPAQAPPSNGGYLPLEKVYKFEPVPAGLSASDEEKILGLQSCLWTEHVQTARYADFMLLPRLSAIAEIGWSPRMHRNYHGFKRRLTKFERMQ